MRWLLLLTLLSTTAGCRYGPGQYWQARGLDLYDTFPASVGGGLGALAQARVTQFAGIGIGWTEEWRVGLDDQRFGPIWWEKQRGIPILRYYRYQDYLDTEDRWSGGNTNWITDDHRLRANSFVFIPAVAREGWIWLPWIPPYFLEVPWETHQITWWNAFDVEAGLFLVAGGVRLGFSPGELIDFLCGIVTADPLEDDPIPDPPLWPDPDAPPAFPPEAPDLPDPLAGSAPAT